MKLITILDPYLFLWEENDHDMFPDKYQLMTIELIEIIEILEENNNEIVFNNFFQSQLEYYYPGIDENLDITKVIYSFLSKISERIIDYSDKYYHEIYSEPNIINYLFSEEIQQETRTLLSTILHSKLEGDDNENLFFVTTKSLREDISSYLKIKMLQREEVIPLISEASFLQDLLNRARRKYEMNPKHQPDSGWGSPFYADDNKAKEMLLHSIQSNNGNSQALYFYDRNKNVFIVFRPHLIDTYHAYENDDLQSIPSDVRRYFSV